MMMDKYLISSLNPITRTSSWSLCKKNDNSPILLMIIPDVLGLISTYDEGGTSIEVGVVLVGAMVDEPTPTIGS